MARYAVRKVIHTAFVAFGVVSLVFVALRLSGDPAANDVARRGDRFRDDRLRPLGAGTRSPSGQDYCGDQPGSTMPSPSVVVTVPPFMTHRATLPDDVFRHRMSALPSPL